MNESGHVVADVFVMLFTFDSMLQVFQQELSKRESNMSQVRETARELISKSEDSMPELQSQLIELTTSWDKVRPAF